MVIREGVIEAKKFGFWEKGWLDNKNAPGPDYYSECKKFNWVTALITKHEQHFKRTGREVPDWHKLSAEELKLVQ